jgi:hypothetical protein
VVVVHIVAAAAVHIAEVVQATDIHHREDRETGYSEACQVGAVLGMESSVVAGRAQRMRRRQPRSCVFAQLFAIGVECAPSGRSPECCPDVGGVCLGKAQTR